MANFKTVTHVIFDMDGVLLNTEDLYTECYKKLCSQYGKVYDWSIKMHIMGMKSYEATKYVIEKLQLPISPEILQENLKKEFPKVFPHAKLLPGAEKIVRHLKDHAIPIAICTGSSTEAFNMKSTNHKEFFAMFDHITLCGDDPEVVNGKPHPDAYIVTNSRFKSVPDPSKVLVFEDAPNGVIAGRDAGMQVIMLPDENIPERLRDRATLVIDSLLDFNPLLFGLPAIKDPNHC